MVYFNSLRSSSQQSSNLHSVTAQSFDGDAFGDGAVLGCDFAGYVEKLGPDVTSFKVGDKIAALIWGGKLRNSPY